LTYVLLQSGIRSPGRHLFGVERANAKSSTLFAYPGHLRVGGWLLTGHDGPLLGMSKFLLSVVGIQELGAGQGPGIEPLQEDIRLSGTLIRQRDDRLPAGFLTVRCNCLKGHIDVSLFRIEDLHDELVSITVRQLENVGPSGQNLPRDLDWLVKGDGGCLVRLVSMSSEYIKKTKSNDQTCDYVKLVYLHFVHLLRYDLLRGKRTRRSPSCMASLFPRSSSSCTLRKGTADTKRRGLLVRGKRLVM
jgi:hypothetical protein